MANPVIHFEIMSRKSDELKGFYAKAFGWSLSETVAGAGCNTTYSRVESVGNGIGGGIGSPPDDYAGHLTFYVAVDKIEDALAQIEQLGGRTMMPPVQVPGGPRIALFTDPESHVVGLVEAQCA